MLTWKVIHGEYADGDFVVKEAIKCDIPYTNDEVIDCVNWIEKRGISPKFYKAVKCFGYLLDSPSGMYIVCAGLADKIMEAFDGKNSKPLDRAGLMVWKTKE